MFIEIIPASFNWIASGVYKGVEAGCAAAKNKHPFISRQCYAEHLDTVSGISNQTIFYKELNDLRLAPVKYQYLKTKIPSTDNHNFLW